ncbi:MAG: nucleotidyltransferase domain-containing protein [candidate division NC10 bacterium]|nr:nucleotidyltransferase domain-containing protein [candidate division NC10 bacterium]
MVLFGSAARGEADEESDLDLLILTKKPVTRPTRHQITDLIFDVNLRYGTNFSSLVVDRDNWERGVVSVLPIHEEILRDGVAV